VIVGIAAIVLGLGFLIASVLAWTGVWRSWARRFPIGLLSAPLGTFAAAGAMFLVGGLVAVDAIPEESPLSFVAAVVAIAGVGLSFWSPSWFGPRWYREDPKLAQPDLGDPATAAAWAASHRAPEAPPTSLDGGEPLEVLRATWFAAAAAAAMPGLRAGTDVGGKLELHREGMLFRAGEWDARARQAATVVEVPAASIRGAHVDRGKLVVETDGEPMTFKVFGARRRASRIRELYDAG
jgi:hypothetical protein